MMILALHPAGLTKSLVSRKRKGGRKRRGWRRLEERQVDKGVCGTGVAVKLLCLPLMEKTWFMLKTEGTSPHKLSHPWGRTVMCQGCFGPGGKQQVVR